MDPLIRFLEKFPLEITEIGKLTCGEKYVCIELKNGHIGVCATLDLPVDLQIEDLTNYDLNRYDHRIALNAYINSKANYQIQFSEQNDIFDKLDFSNYKNIVMIGYFKSLVDKFIDAGINLTIFDKVQQDEILEDMTKQPKALCESDAVILTSTTLFNKTFQEIVDANNEGEIFMLGPSTILDSDMFLYKNIKMIFGAIFEKSDNRIHEIIKEGGGTRSFLPFMKKVYLSHNTD